MELVFLGTGGAWALPELDCRCRICREMRKRGERRGRTAFALKGEHTLLVDCGPDIRRQLMDNGISRPDAVLITHEHGDHFLGLDELASFKRNSPSGDYQPIPVYMTRTTREVVAVRFGYLEGMGVLVFREVEAGAAMEVGEFQVTPFKTNHGSFAAGSVGYTIRFPREGGGVGMLLYTSDFVDTLEAPEKTARPDILVIQSFWLNEPVHNRPNHMSFQRAISFIERWSPREVTYLVHMGDGDMVPGDPANVSAKKYEPADPLAPPQGGEPYPIPLCQDDWRLVVEQVMRDRRLDFKVIPARDGLKEVF